MDNIFGKRLMVMTFGESHGPGVGAVVDGVPAGIEINEEIIQGELDRRRPGVSEFVSPRKEKDRVEILSGINGGKTIGSPIALLVRNRDAKSGDYDNIKEKFRPGHGDYTYFKKYGIPPQPGGGRSSGRETLGRVAAGAIAKVILNETGATIRSCVSAIAGVEAIERDYDFAEGHPLRCPDPEVAAGMEKVVREASEARDSVGGIVEIVVDNIPPGLGDPVFGKLDARLGLGLLSMGAVKGVEIGAGFRAAMMTGSENNDPITGQGFSSNNAGGVLGGISTGERIFIRFGVKPTPSIGVPQDTIDLQGRGATIEIKGRHDPCICPRIAVVGEAMTALVLADALLLQRSLG